MNCPVEGNTWMLRFTRILTFGAIAAVSVQHLWNIGNVFLAAIFLILSIGIICYLWISYSRDEIKSGQVVVITGCDSGLGYSLALHCQRLGATVVAGVLNHDGPGAKELLKNDVFIYPLDVTKEKSVKDFVSYVRGFLKQKNLVMRALVNNAGVMIFGEFEWQTKEQIRHQVEVNFLGTLRITQEMMPVIRENLSRIILVTSHCSHDPLPGVAVYGGTKAAIQGWATGIRVELKKFGIDVVCFIPGSFVTDSNILAQQSKQFEKMQAEMSDEAKDFYGDYFTRYSEYFKPIARDVGAKILPNSRIYKIFEGSLLDKYPSAVYKCEPWRYFFYHTLFKITPTRIRDRLVEKFVQLPAWHDKKTKLNDSHENAVDETDQYQKETEINKQEEFLPKSFDENKQVS